MKEFLEAIFLGIIQGLTEFLPVSSSGHLELAKALIGYQSEESLKFTIVVHGGTVLSTIVVFRKEILELIKGLFKFKYNEETKYVLKIAISMIPIFVVGIFFKDELESIFVGNILLVGVALLFTGALLMFTHFAKSREREVSYRDSFLIGLSQAVAVIPGISRSGSTIASALLLGVKKEAAARFSFLMVLAPIIGANLLDMLKYDPSAEVAGSSGAGVLLAGFVASFLTGWLACTWMINIVKKGKLTYFAIYCFIVGIIAIATSF
ncbi:undecaprenyl-diphosphatase [Fulvitalea axinellae]|uniref:Undecaprenyl-diphosphatase n=1 Tax=Fulvitalea axinellae TaxID=1182444 RepID=A0AAU9CIS7_9BACT|nr:undecaprenyl-diphosphatase [Fulvitalea axinellae]